MPDIALARHRMIGGTVEITAAELAMTDDEAGRLLAQLGVSLDDDALETLVERTEGWPGALHLAALALTGRRAAAPFIISGR